VIQWSTLASACAFSGFPNINLTQSLWIKSTHLTTLATALTRELFQRTRISATIGVFGVAIMVYPHLESVPHKRSFSWACVMVVLLILRLLNSFRNVANLTEERPAMRLCNTEALLCALIGVGWGSSVFVFDSNGMDPLFYLRFLILAGAMAFIVNSTAVFLRVSSAYTLTIGASAITFILTSEYVQPRGSLLFSVVFYMLMISAFAISMNRQIRVAITNQLAVATLTEELKSSLDVERNLRSELSVLAHTDELSGVLNRRGVLIHLNSELARCRRFQSNVAVLMMDIDHFKRVNDTFGHATGDTVLRETVEILRSQLRETDVLGRVGGEEFLVILPSMDTVSAVAAAERMRGCVEQSPIDLPGHPIQITISVGVATYHHGDDADSLIARADVALYAAKTNGRNLVESSI
jgi:diguanylate cyclase (GGDEF)-like protein